MKYVISDSGIVPITETQGTLQNISNDKIEVSHSIDFNDFLIVYPREKLTFNSQIYARASSKIHSGIVFSVVRWFL